MTIREEIEAREEVILSPYAAKSKFAVRDREEQPDYLRTAFQRDRDRIIHSKCFRRLKHKTQVYIAPGGSLSHSDDTYLGSWSNRPNHCAGAAS